MRIDVNGSTAFASTGGKAHEDGKPFVIFLHGSGQSHLSWTQQVRVFAYDGYNVMAPDFPAHGHSEGEPLNTIEEMADWVIALMDAAGAKEADIVAHSQGCLVTLELAARYPDRVKKTVFIAGAAAIPVNDALVGMAETKEPKAIAAMVSWGSGALGHKFDNTVPGASLIGTGLQLMHANAEGALAADLNACNAYTTGADQAAKISGPSLCIWAEKDKMTPLKSGFKLSETLPGSETIVIKNAGHMLPPENPREVNEALRGFLK